MKNPFKNDTRTLERVIERAQWKHTQRPSLSSLAPEPAVNNRSINPLGRSNFYTDETIIRVPVYDRRTDSSLRSPDEKTVAVDIVGYVVGPVDEAVKDATRLNIFTTHEVHANVEPTLTGVVDATISSP